MTVFLGSRRRRRIVPEPPPEPPPLEDGNRLYGPLDFSILPIGQINRTQMAQVTGPLQGSTGSFDQYMSVVNDPERGVVLRQRMVPTPQVGTQGSPVVQWIRGSRTVNVFTGRRRFLGFWIKFDPNFDWGGTNEGGKLPGFGGGSTPTGGATATDGFTARLMWRTGGRLVVYAYHQDAPNGVWEDFRGTTDYYAQKGRWIYVQQEIVINSSSTAYDGECRVWFDGVLNVERTGIRWVADDATLVDCIYYSAFHGGFNNTYGQWSPDRDCFLFTAGFVVGTTLESTRATGQSLPWYSNGTQPAKTLSSLRTVMRQQYDDWIALTSATDGMPAGMPAGAKRIKVVDQVFGNWPQVGGTVSEGMGYVLLLTAWLSNPALPSSVRITGGQAEFDAYWKYVKHYLNERGLMAWSIWHDGTIGDSGSATDGDVDIALALWHAHDLWGSAGAVNYQAEALAMTNAMRDWDFTPATYTGPGGPNVMCNGDNWHFDTNSFMPDYYSPAHFRLFAAKTGQSRWLDIIARNKQIALDYFHANFTGGVVPDRCKRDGTIENPSNPYHYTATYNSVRMGWRVVLDLLWNGAAGITQEMPKRAATKAKNLWGTGAAIKAPEYDLNLTAGQAWSNNAGYGLFAPCALTDPGFATFAAEIVDAIAADTELDYYNQGVACMAMALMAGVATPDL